MITFENECYIRIILLLLRTGREIIGIVIRNALLRKEIQFNELLVEKKHEIFSSEFITEQDKVSLNSPSPELSEFSKWDISLLSFIALKFLELNTTEREVIEKIQNFWNKYLNVSSRTIDKNKYMPACNEITRAFTRFGNHVTIEECTLLDDTTDEVINQEDMAAVIKDLKSLIPSYGGSTLLRQAFEDIEKIKQESSTQNAENENHNQQGGQANISTEKSIDHVWKTDDGGHGDINSKKRNQDNTDGLTVAFHILLSPNFKFDENLNDTVVIIFKNENMGEQKKMEFLRRLPDNHVEMECELKLPKNEIIEYKYYVTRNSKSDKNIRHTKRKPLYDLYYSNGDNDENAYRKLRFNSSKCKTSEVWHQYDCVVNRKQKKKIFWNKSTTKVLLESEVALSTRVFGRKLSEQFLSEKPCSEVVLRFYDITQQLMDGMKRIYLIDSRCFESDRDLKQMIGKVFVEELLSSPTFSEYLILRADQTDEQFQQKMYGRVFLMFALHIFQFPDMKGSLNDIYHKLCLAFRITPEKEHETCKELKFLQKYFTYDQQEILRIGCVGLCEAAVERTHLYKDPSWLYVMPLIHFLSGTCLPYKYGKVNDQHTESCYNEQWWGISVVHDAYKKFSSRTNQVWKIGPMDVLTAIQPLFEIDFLLPRALMICLDAAKLYEVISTNKIPSEVCLASFTWHLRRKNQNQKNNEWLKKEENVFPCVVLMKDQFKSEFRECLNSPSEIKWRLCHQLSMELFSEIVDGRSSERHVQASVSSHVFLISTVLYKISLKQNSSEELNTIAMSTIQISNKVVGFLLRTYCDWLNDSCLVVWDSFVAREEDLSSDKYEIVKDWNRSITNEMEKNILEYIVKKESEERSSGKQCKVADTFIGLYCNYASKLTTSTKICLRNTALKVYKNRYKVNFEVFSESGRTEYLSLMSEMFLEEWNKNKAGVKDDREFLQLMLKWKPFHHIVKIVLTKKGFGKPNVTCCEKVQTLADEIGALSNHLLTGTLKVGDLALFRVFRETLIDIIDMNTDLDDKVPVLILEKAVEVRIEELETYEKKREDVVALVTLCFTIPAVDVSYLKQELKERCDIQNHTFSEFCIPAKISKQSDPNLKYEPHITAFQLPDGVEQILKDMCMLQKSSVFVKIWEERCKQNEFVPSLNDLPVIWELAKTEWKTCSERIKNGEILFKDFENIIGSGYGEDYTRIREELERMEVPVEIASKSVEQLFSYRRLETCTTGANVILQLKRELKLEGDFQHLQNIASGEHSGLKMIQFDERFMDTFRFLSDFSEDRLKCIHTYLKCQPLVDWLREWMPTYKETQVFIELVSMSVGDNPFNIGKVQALNAAVTGYAPLIFEIEKKSDSKAILDLCRAVWEELDANHKLTEQLENINQELNWLQEIKRAHGSVEVSTMLQTKTINSLGIYTVGKKVIDGVKTQENGNRINAKILEIGDTINLTVREQWESSELKTLQMRLMNVADKAELELQHKEKLNKEIAEIAERLSRELDKKKPHKHFVRSDILNLKERLELMTEKMELASELQVQLKRDISIEIEFFLQERSQISKHYTFSDLQDLQSRLMLVIGKAEQGRENIDTFTKIFDSITRLAKIYVKLNCDGCVLFKDFSARFICDSDPNRPGCVILQFVEHDDDSSLTGELSGKENLADMIREIANFMETCLICWIQNIEKKRKKYRQLDYFTINQLVILQTELAKVETDEGPCCLIYPLLSAVKKNCNEGDVANAVAEAKRSVDEIQRSKTASDEDIAPETEDEQFIKRLVALGFKKDLAREATEYVSVQDIQKGVEWCMANANKDGSEKTSLENADINQKESWSYTGDTVSIKDLFFTIRQRSGVGVKYLIEKMKEVWTRFETSTFSASSRNYISLDLLGMILEILSKQESRTIRRLPKGMNPGCPNLIVCPIADVIATTLTMYMSGEEQKLPQSDEVVLCTKDTSIDEVDIFLRRAFDDQSQQLHCFVNADLLPYDVCDATLKRIEEYLDKLKTTNARYQLIIICSFENRNRSGMVSFLEKFRRETPKVEIDQIKAYTDEQLKGTDMEGYSAAWALDMTCSTVRVLKSSRAGVGKTLFKLKKEKELQTLKKETITLSTVSIPLQGQCVDLQYVSKKLLKHVLKPSSLAARIVHIDISHEVQDGVDFLLFNLLILGYLVDHTGYVWRKSPLDLYLIESMPIMISSNQGKENIYLHTILQVLPDMTCLSPLQCFEIYKSKGFQNQKQFSPLFDETELESETYQMPYKYLKQLSEPSFKEDKQIQAKDCLEVFLRYCGIKDPSWSELNHFVFFLHAQLKDFQNNTFVSKDLTRDLPGFSQFVLRFLIQMSKDFATRSLQISEESPTIQNMQTGLPENAEDIVEQYQMKRKWESSPHAYVFFNRGGDSFTFLGFNISEVSFDLIDEQTKNVIEKKIMERVLYRALSTNKVELQENFQDMDRSEKLKKLRMVMGVTHIHDPDPTYELTTDNIKKIMAIYMRFRCDIPVIVMGETGCGKTRMVQFMSAIQLPPEAKNSNMVLMKVHGGTTNKDIISTVKKAERIAAENKEKYGDHVYTVLFFDEVNSTSSVGLVKEILCDKTMEGEKLTLCSSLKFVAACNPYRKHPDDVIKKLEEAGLGYHVHADDTTDRLGKVPMRRLVYRVQPLPQSLIPLVWDFGKLDNNVEILYIRQMVRRYESTGKLPKVDGSADVISEILAASQQFMRDKMEEGSFVSLRDVNRVLVVMSWFWHNGRSSTLFDLMNEKMNDKSEDVIPTVTVHDGTPGQVIYSRKQKIDDLTRSLILALGICYHACLKKRRLYREHIEQFFRSPCELTGGSEQIFREIDSCQDVFLDNVVLEEENISRNLALKENVFMMVVCIELRIPLFIIGKPGSSKSLAKTVVINSMRGNTAKNLLFKRMKKVKMTSYQCSPLATPEGIVGVFREAAGFQKDNMETFVSVVVLDEVGLAEDSPKLPLKTLHPLLEDGCVDDEDPKDYMKVAFIGISNWALDPAKMNRGIVVTRDVPDLKELITTARGIVQYNKSGCSMEHLIEPLAESYLELFEKAKEKEKREFFGLRDFYSLVKMVYCFVKETSKKPDWNQIVHAVKRNFGGLERVDPVDSFKKHLAQVMTVEDMTTGNNNPDYPAARLINECIAAVVNSKMESRYLLLLVESFGSISVVQQLVLRQNESCKPVVIFGSSFRRDQDYTQVCRNINKIKLCMERGRLVILLNLENLYESLYDALNQYYSCFGGVRYVDLGLGTHRVKCPVHKDFRLIVLAQKQTVYKKFPIPLINRLEKHCFSTSTMLEEEQKQLVVELEQWAKQLTRTKSPLAYRKMAEITKETDVGDIFIGYHEDMFITIVFHVWDRNMALIKRTNSTPVDRQKVFEEAKDILLWCATPDAIIRLGNNQYSLEWKTYFERQTHSSLHDYLHAQLVKEKREELFAQVTTHSKLLTDLQRKSLSNASGIELENVLILESLTSFDTEHQFTEKIQNHMKKENANQAASKSAKLIIIQCEYGDENEELIACSRYIALGESEKMTHSLHGSVYFVIIVQLPKVAGGCFKGFQCGKWQSVHIDDLGSDEFQMPPITEMHGQTIGGLFSDAIGENITTDILDQTERSSITYVAPKKLDVRKLILECVQLAVANVKYKPGSTKTETARAYSILRLFHEDFTEGKTSFVQSVCSLVVNIIVEKERKSGTSTCNSAKFWLEHEAALPTNINKAGTFRNSCVFYLEQKLSPVLAVLIAFLDTNSNFALLYETTDSWKKSLWFSVISTSGAIDIKCNTFMAPMNNTQAQEMFVVSTGSDEKAFKLQMPFSWLFMDKVNDILKNQVPTDDEIDEDDTPPTVKYSHMVLKDSSLGEILERITDEKTIGMVIGDYLNDFMHTMYSAASDLEFELVKEAVYNVVEHCVAKSKSKSLLTRVINVHLAFGIVAQRLKYFREINTVWKECCEVVDFAKKNKPDQIFIKENDLTTFATYLLLEKLTSKGVLKPTEKPFAPKEWLEDIFRYRPVIEAVISFYNGCQTSEFSIPQRTLRKIKAVWGRVVVMKLFIQNFCLSENEPPNSSQLFYILWEMVDEDRIVSMEESLGAVEKFLQYCHDEAAKSFGSVILTCAYCKKMIEDDPLVLPCKNNCLICNDCVRSKKGSRDRTCWICKDSFPDEWTPKNTFQKSQADKLLQDFRRKCNAFFMDFVSQMCLADENRPSEKLVEKLLTYIWCKTSDTQSETKRFSPLGSGYDPRPIFRSFLLQIVLQTSEQHALNHLEQYFSELSKTCTEGKDFEHDQLCVLVIQCLEDKLLAKMKSPDIDKLSFSTEVLQLAGDQIFASKLTINKLYGIARVKVGLAQVAAHVFDNVREDSTTKPDYKLLNIAHSICTDSLSRWPRLYLKKIICRYYGLAVFEAIVRSDEQSIRWIVEGDNYSCSEMVERCDRYIIVGEEYKQLSKCILDVILSDDVDKLVGQIESSKVPLRTECCLRLAVHREITCSGKSLPMSVDSLKKAIDSCKNIKDKVNLQDLLDNNLSPKHVQYSKGQGLVDQGLQCLIVHFWAAISCTETPFLKPLKALMKCEEHSRRMYLPTMPNDDVEEVRKALLGIEGNIKLYNCPQGHPYSVGNCGRPMVESRCNVCGEKIGGTNHKLLESNTAFAQRPMMGHILGSAAIRRANPTDVREMTPAESAMLRLLVHMAMFIGVGKDCQIIQASIHPEIKADEVEEFVWNHIKIDLNDICHVLDRSQDDIFLFIHYIVEGLAKPINSGLMAAHINTQLLTKEDRDYWESTFTKTYLKKHIQDVDAILDTLNTTIMNDDRIGNKHVLYEINETSVKTDDSAVEDIRENPRAWRYRTPISLENLRQTLEANASVRKQYEVLHLFVKHEHNLRALKYIPSIFRLHRALFKKYQYKLSSTEAMRITIQQLKSENVAGIETQPLIQDYKDAWELVREDLKKHVCRTPKGSMVVEVEICDKKLEDTTPLTMLLPTIKSKDNGLCSFALLDFLFRKQNDFLDMYAKITGRTTDTKLAISPMEVTSAHLISFDFQHDLLPLLMANCQYSFEMGKGTKMEFDFASIERQLMDRFLFSKSRIDVGSDLKIELMIFRTEMTNATVFEQLGEKIKQESLSTMIKTQICQEMKSLPDICKSLHNLDIAISILRSSGGQNCYKIHDFMKKKLLMKETLCSGKAREICHIKHAESLWLLMALQKSKVMTDQKQSRQNIFETLPASFHENMSENDLSELRKFIDDNISLEKLSVFVEILHDFILLKISDNQNADEENIDPSGKKIKDWLSYYISEREVTILDDATLSTFPESLKYIHIVHVWTETYLILTKKQSALRR